MKFSKEKPQKIHKKIGLAKKVGFLVVGIIAMSVLIWLIYYYVHFVSYDEYKQYLSSYDYEEGSPFVAITETAASVDGMMLVTENEYLKLYTNTKTAEIAIYDKRNGNTVYSNPVNADDDPIANETNIRYLKSQFILNYFNKSRAAGVYDSYSMSVEREQIQVEKVANGIRYIYDVGDHSTTSTGIVPTYITKEKMTEVQAALSEKDATNLGRYYVDSTTVTGMLELNGVARKNTKTIQKIQGYLVAAGFTQEDYYEQMELGGVEQEETVSFNIALEYRLEEDGVKVSIPASAIKEYGEAKLYRIQLLRYMGASSGDEKGYMVVPNGSGSIINFNNGKINAADYSQYVYDMDPLADGRTQIENTEKVRLALFGICRENSSILATLEDGASMAFITSGVAGRYSNFNYIYSTFMLRGYDILSTFGSTGNEADLPIVEENIYDVNYTVKYTLLTDEYEGYSGIANYYRERLIKEGILTSQEASSDIPFYYDIVGGVKKTAFFLGTQYLSVKPITTFEEAGQISDDLAAIGINNQVMNYQGWFNGGYFHDVTDKVKVISKLGGTSGLEELSRVVKENGGSFYADTALQKVTYISKRYNMNYETSKYFGAGYYAYFANVNPATLTKMSDLGYAERGHLLVSPKFLTRYVNGFVDDINNIDISGISLRDLGDELHSDQKRTNIIDREQSLEIVVAQLEKLKNTKKNLMISGGNEYSLAYASDLINVPISDNSYFIVDEDIPLYEMILHGCIDYASGVINYYDDIDKADLTLNLIEYGASPHYLFTKDSANEMKYTGLNKYYSTQYDIWKKDAVSLYEDVNAALHKVTGKTIVNHEIFENDVRKVTYCNGVVFYINYSLEDVTIDGVLIPAKNYEMEEK